MFLISPLVVLILGFRTNNPKVFWITLRLFMIGSSVTMKVDPTSDLGAYYKIFLLSHNEWLNEGISGAFTFFLSQTASSSEPALNLLIFLSSALGREEFWLTASIGILASYFIIEVLKELYNRFKNSEKEFNGKIKILLLVCLSFSSISWTINGRYWLAFWVFSLLILRFFKQVEKNNHNLKKLLPLLLFVPAIHAGWLVIILVFLGFVLTYRLKYARKLYLTIFILVNFLRPFAVDYVTQFSGYLGGGYASKANIYVGVLDYQNNSDIEQNVHTPWFIIWKIKTYTTLIPVIFFLMFFFYKDSSEWGINLENWILVIGSLAVLVYDIPSLGGRTTGVWSAFMLFYLLARFSQKQIPSFLKPALISIAAIFTFVMLRLEFVAISGYYAFGNIFITWIGDDSSIRDLLITFI